LSGIFLALLALIYSDLLLALLLQLTWRTPFQTVQFLHCHKNLTIGCLGIGKLLSSIRLYNLLPRKSTSNPIPLFLLSGIPSQDTVISNANYILMHVRSLYKPGSLMAVPKETSKYKGWIKSSDTTAVT
jgi:hypothetical protein